MKALALALALAVMTTACMTPQPVETTRQDRYEAWHMGEITDQAFSYLICVSHHMNTGKPDIHARCDEEKTRLMFRGLGLVRTPAGDKAFAALFASGIGMNVDLFWYQRCLALVRGKSLLPALRAVNPKQARQACLARFSKNLTNTASKADPEKVCNSEIETQALVEWISHEIEVGRECEYWNKD
jgi:hypothetical protein